MEIPRFWAEHQEQRTLPGRRQVTLRRFGWSSVSAADARQHAEQRVREAWAAFDSGRKPTRRERKVAYAGADGLPIREEIISEHPEADAVVTRNAYGARCLNVPDLLFADVDLGEPGERRSAFRTNLVWAVVVVGLLAAVAVRQGGPTRAALVSAAVILALVGGWRVMRAWRKWHAAEQPDLALAPVRGWCEAHPRWRVHVYRTPAGLRLLATHETIDPHGEESAAFFSAVGADPTYRLMCLKQDCFRARVSPKPWRIGIAARIGGGTWPPITEPAVLHRTRWVEEYEAKARDYAACERLAELGDGAESQRGRAVRELHDRLCQVGSRLPIA